MKKEKLNCKISPDGSIICYDTKKRNFTPPPPHSSKRGGSLSPKEIEKYRMVELFDVFYFISRL